MRLELGDVGEGDGTFVDAAEVQDATITHYLSTGATVLATAAKLAWGLAAKYAKMVDVDVDRQLTRASQRYAQYVELAKRLDRAAAAESPTATSPIEPVYAGPVVTGVGDLRGPLDVCDLPFWAT